jgi:ribosome maturation factor RimP
MLATRAAGWRLTIGPLAHFLFLAPGHRRPQAAMARTACRPRAEVRGQIRVRPEQPMQQVDPKLARLVRSVVEPMGYECVGVDHVSGTAGGAVLRVYIDHADGIGLDDCEAVSHQLSGALDVADPIAGQYDLEVSSPGLDRPLFELAHFRRFTGSRVQVRLLDKVDGRRRFAGRILGVDGEDVLLDVDGARVALPFARIELARLVPEF